MREAEDGVLAARTAELRRAERDGTTLEPWASGASTPLSEDDAYAIQDLLIDAWVADGRTVAGWKLGLTSRSSQAAAGRDQPVYGRLMADVVYESGAVVPAAGMRAPLVEPEVALVLGRDLSGADTDLAQTAAAVEAVRPALELVDFRIRDELASPPELVSDNVANAAVVLGAGVPLADVRVDDIACTIELDEVEAARGSSRDVLGSPLTALLWLVHALAQGGRGLAGGQVVLTGSMTAPQRVRAGQRVAADLAGVGTVRAELGTVS